MSKIDLHVPPNGERLVNLFTESSNESFAERRFLYFLVLFGSHHSNCGQTKLNSALEPASLLRLDQELYREGKSDPLKKQRCSKLIGTVFPYR